ncbi:MAG: COR domain-containing protein, partial [Exilibacterium sp.]
ITEGIYTIINWANNSDRYRVSISEFDSVFKEKRQRFPKKQDLFLFRLLLQYELAYEIAPSRELVIPHLLDDDQPAELPSFPVGESLLLRYRSDTALPKDIISRFIVKSHRYIRDTKDAWRYGVILEDSSAAIAVVRQDKLRLEVSVKNGKKTHFLSELRNYIVDIFTSYKNKLAEAEYRIFYEEFGFRAQIEGREKELWLTEEEIGIHAREGRLFYDVKSRQNLDMAEPAKQYNINLQSGAYAFIGEQQDIQFNIGAMNLGLQGSLNDLVEQIKGTGNSEEVKTIEEASLFLEKIEEETDKKKIIKSGALKPVERILNELADDKSRLNKALKGVDKGVSIAQDLAQQYNKIADWLMQ